MNGPPPTDGYSTQATDPLSSVKAAAPELRQWWLCWVYPEPWVTPLDRAEMSLGRDSMCDVMLADTKVSRRHATIQLSGQTPPQIRDLGSSNGTAVDGQRCDAAWLRDGCVLRVGQSLAVVVHTERQPKIAKNLSTDARFSYVGSNKLDTGLQKAERIARLPGAVFIQAETGTGKEYLARRVHAASARPGEFVAVNCAGVRGELAVAQLFGHVKGAFTGAHHNSPGALRQADQGTVFLDEVAELPLDSQALLLRATQTREVTPLGSSLAVATDFRVICASHAELIELVAKQAFRADLYYRLSTHQLSLPPLRQRKEDIVALFEQAAGLDARRLQSRLVEQLLLHHWPGNIRELENVAMGMRAQTGEPEQWSSIPFLPSVTPSSARSLPEAMTFEQLTGPDSTLQKARLLTSEEWRGLFAKYGGNAAEVSRATGIKVSTVKRYFAPYRLRQP